MNKIISFIKHEPVVVLAGFVDAALTVVVNLGFHLTPDQRSAINGLALAIVALVTRQFVSPTSSGPGDGSGA